MLLDMYARLWLCMRGSCAEMSDSFSVYLTEMECDGTFDLPALRRSGMVVYKGNAAASAAFHAIRQASVTEAVDAGVCECLCVRVCV